MPYHKELDGLTERYLGRQRLGTTKRGIGPDLRRQGRARGAARGGPVRHEDLPPEARRRAAREERDPQRACTTACAMRAADIETEYAVYAERLRPYIEDTVTLLHEALDRGETVLFEGAQGTLLDLDHGTYPFVTSSNPVAGGALVGAGVGPKVIDRVIGITKAYVTRVGAGPFPTELSDDIGGGDRGARPRVRDDDGAAPQGRLVRRGPRAVRGAGERAHRALPHQARRPRRVRDAEGVPRVPLPGRRVRSASRRTSRSSTMRGPCTPSSTAGVATSPR